jgi:putative intracellular protease/amidase
MPQPVLFVLTSASKLLNGAATGWYLPEAAHPALVLQKANIDVVFASPEGGEAPLDQVSVDNFKDDESVHFLESKEWQAKYKNTKKLAEVTEGDYSAIFVVGGVSLTLQVMNRG